MDGDPYEILEQLFEAALGAADPYNSTIAALPPRPNGRVVVVGAGKAAHRMAEAAEDCYGDVEGLIVVPDGQEATLSSIKVLQAAHPVPDERSAAAAREMLALVSTMEADDHLVALFSGGGSSLLCLPAEGITLEEKQKVTDALLRSGAPIKDINVIRKHLSAIKGGRLAQAAFPAKVSTLVVSDVPGDDPAMVASGPTLPEPMTRGDALAILDDHKISLSEGAKEALRSATTLKADDPGLEGAFVQTVLRSRNVLDTVAAVAETMGMRVKILGDAVQGEARDIGRQHAAIAIEARSKTKEPMLILSGGETTVTLEGDSGRATKGGRNTEYLLGLALGLNGSSNVHAMAIDTDGIDGVGGHAGAIVMPDTLSRAKEMGLDPQAALVDHDSAGFFEKLDELIVTGLTGTNVNDFRAILVTYEGGGGSSFDMWGDAAP